MTSRNAYELEARINQNVREIKKLNMRKIPGNETADRVVEDCARIIADSVMRSGFRELTGTVYMIWQILATHQERATKKRKVKP